MMKQDSPRRKKIRLLVAGFSCLFFVLAASPAGFAQCEPAGDAAAAANTVESQQASNINSMASAIISAYNADIQMIRTQLDLDPFHSALLKRMDWLWRQWSRAWTDMTQQLAASTVYETRQLARIDDASNKLEAALEMQKKMAEAKQRYQPTGQACRFDTTAAALSASRKISAAAATGYADDFVKIGDNRKGSLASSGDAALRKARWEIYEEKFCDGSAYNGRAGCDDTNPGQNMHVLPSRTVFAKETIDMTDEDTRDAVTELMFNITGYTAPETIAVTALPASGGMQQRQTNREYIAQMDAIGALAYSVIAERISGQPAPEIKASRQRLGVMDASDRPSAREIRESIVEQLWDPAYYKELYDNPGTVAQKELYLKAYSLVMLYDMIAKQEKISNAYAIETANILDATAPGRTGVPQSATK